MGSGMTTLLRGALAIEIALVCLAALAVLGHALLLAWRRRWRGDVVAVGREELLAAVVGAQAPGDADLVTLRGLRRHEQLLLLTDVARSLSGRSRVRLGAVAESLGVLTVARRWCRRRSWKRRLLGLRLLSVLAGEDETVPTMVSDPHPEVRAQALEWLADHPSDPGVEVLVGALDDPAPRCRFIAKNALVRLGGASASAVRHRLEPGDEQTGHDGTGNGLRAGLDVAAWIADTDFLAIARQLADHPDEDVRAGAMRVLGSIGGGEVEQVLMNAVEVEPDAVRIAAARSLGRLQQWRAGSLLASLLQSPNWEVRRAGALALLDLGAPGMVLLRRAAAADEAGSALARQTLETRSVTRPDAQQER